MELHNATELRALLARAITAWHVEFSVTRKDGARRIGLTPYDLARLARGDVQYLSADRLIDAYRQIGGRVSFQCSR